ncbi:DUF1080 domain-containing protein [Novipirellula artificiosorum]|uniref:3-keto-alpha-glucoside-1,2-lyase/3-keto-2-hydroxy-glucal hydratase domain-containing protein n=1 Tax=Novipirellula artificiosorum TaxID=2528016 RepID=A0A5C6E0P7_9BACT|nr:family 16 glycoside hydrolase [Novipirellula artificiosorum]TWU42430.1 hypothetical protein Poly41_07270 [Novipirellula artificiosorum]
MLPHRSFAAVLLATLMSLVCAGADPGEWISLFDGKSLAGWRAAEHPDTWSVNEGCLVASGKRSHLFYDGDVANHDFRNFELIAECKTEAAANSGIFFHTRYQESGFPEAGYEVQVNNTHRGSGNYRELKRTGSLYAVRNIYQPCVQDGIWFPVKVKVTGNRIRVWVNGYPTVDYLQPADPIRKDTRSNRVLSSGTIALQGHDPGSRVAYRSVSIRILADDANSEDEPRVSSDGYGTDVKTMDQFAGAYIPVIDCHVHLRGGMTVEKAMDRQAVTGMNVGVLKNLGEGWPIETDQQLQEFIDSVDDRPVFVGVQVNDRGWHKKHSPQLLERLDFVLADTMIMPMPTDDSPPVKLFQPDQFTIEDPEAWMLRYVKHNLRVLSEPATILANPTWLPDAVADQYDELWTDQRMRTIIEAANANHVALEINAGSGYPHERFIRMAKSMGAKFSFGSNNFDDVPHDMTRCLEAITKYGLTKKDMYVPGAD